MYRMFKKNIEVLDLNTYDFSKQSTSYKCMTLKIKMDGYKNFFDAYANELTTKNFERLGKGKYLCYLSIDRSDLRNVVEIVDIRRVL